MLIQPIEPVSVTIKVGDERYGGLMISLSETELEISCQDYLDKESHLFFVAKYFRGTAVIRDIKFDRYCFSYKLEIENIQFQPGLLINTRL